MTMRNKLIEAAARAIAGSWHGEPVDEKFLFGECTGGLVHIQSATAAVDTVLGLLASEPSRDILDAGRDVGYDAPYGLAEIRQRWQAMLGAIK